MTFNAKKVENNYKWIILGLSNFNMYLQNFKAQLNLKKVGVGVSAGSLNSRNKFMQQAFISVFNVMQIRERNIKTRCAFEPFMMLRDPFVELLNRV